MVRSTRKAVNKFRSIRFPGTERRLGLPPGHFTVPKGEKISDIHFLGTEGRLGLPPKVKLSSIDQRKKAKNRIKKFEEFDIGGELI